MMSFSLGIKHAQEVEEPDDRTLIWKATTSGMEEGDLTLFELWRFDPRPDDPEEPSTDYEYVLYCAEPEPTPDWQLYCASTDPETPLTGDPIEWAREQILNTEPSYEIEIEQTVVVPTPLLTEDESYFKQSQSDWRFDNDPDYTLVFRGRVAKSVPSRENNAGLEQILVGSEVRVYAVNEEVNTYEICVDDVHISDCMGSYSYLLAQDCGVRRWDGSQVFPDPWDGQDTFDRSDFETVENEEYFKQSQSDMVGIADVVPGMGIIFNDSPAVVEQIRYQEDEDNYLIRVRYLDEPETMYDSSVESPGECYVVLSPEELASPSQFLPPTEDEEYFKQSQMAMPALVVASWRVKPTKPGRLIQGKEALRVELRKGSKKYQLVPITASQPGQNNKIMHWFECHDPDQALKIAERTIQSKWYAPRYTITREGAEGTQGQTRWIYDEREFQTYFKQAMPAHWGRENIDDLPQHDGLDKDDAEATYQELFQHLPTLPKPVDDTGQLKPDDDLHMHIVEHATWDDDHSRWMEHGHGSPTTNQGVPDVFAAFRWTTMFRDPKTNQKRLLQVNDTDAPLEGPRTVPTVKTTDGRDTGRAIGEAWDKFCTDHGLDGATYMAGVTVGPGSPGQIIERYLADGAVVQDVRFGPVPEQITVDGKQTRSEQHYTNIWDEMLGTGNARYNDNAGKYPETGKPFIPEEKKQAVKTNKPPAQDITGEVERYGSWRRKQGKPFDVNEFKRWINKQKRQPVDGGQPQPIPDPEQEVGYYCVMPGMTGPQASVPRNVIHAQYDVRYHGTAPYQMESQKSRLDALIHLVGDMQRTFSSPHKFYQPDFHDGQGLDWESAVYWLFYGAYPKFKDMKEAEQYLRHKILRQDDPYLGTEARPTKKQQPSTTGSDISSLIDELGD
jgi:hypothetical protein